MGLFGEKIVDPINLLPYDGVVKYYGVQVSLKDANSYLDRLLTNVQWRHDEAVVCGKHIVTKRQVAWYADEAFEYSYSGVTKKALPWIDVLLELRAIAEQVGDTFNSCLINLYSDGTQGMAWHSDAEKTLKKNGAIASMSFGAERKFSFKHKHTKDTHSLVLEHGSLLLMGGEVQSYWQHRLPASRKITTPRVNLTFRNIVY